MKKSIRCALSALQMRKVFTVLALLTMCLSYSSCSSDDEEAKFDYPMETVYGTWHMTEAQISGVVWTDVTDWNMFITFNPDGSYTINDVAGKVYGTYKASGKTIIVYVDKKEYQRYVIKSITGNHMDGTMIDNCTSMNIKAIKK